MGAGFRGVGRASNPGGINSAAAHAAGDCTKSCSSAKDLAEPCAVDVRDVREVQHNFLMALVDEAVDLVLEQLVALAEGDLALQVEHYHVTDGPFLDLHGNAPDEIAM